MSKRLEHEKVATRYAKALFESALQEGSLQPVSDSLFAVNALFRKEPDCLRFFENPGFPEAEKTAFIDQQMGASAIQPKVSQLLRLLLQNKRIAALPEIVAQFSRLLRRHENTTQAEVISAGPMESEFSERLRHLLENAFGFQRVDLLHHVEPALLGGVVVKLQDQIIDGSYLGRLETLRQRIETV